MLMRQMRQNTKIIMLVTAIAFVALMVFEWGMDMSGQTAGGDLGRVGRTSVSVQEYNDAYRSIYDQVQRSQEEPISSQQNREIEDMAWDEIVNRILIRNELSRRGIRVSDDEIRQAAQFSPPPEFRTDPAFLDENGQFDFNRYQQFLGQAAQDPIFLRQLEQYYRDVLPREKLLRQVTAGIFVSDRELWERWRARNERVDATYLSIVPDERIADGAVEVTRAEVEAYYRDQRADFELPARAQVRYTWMDKAPGPADTARALEAVQAARQEILDGEDFEAVASRESADLGTAADGGRLGAVRPGDLIPALDEAAFSIPVGEIGEPIETPFGYHLVQVVSRDEEEAEVRHILIPIERTPESEIAMLTRADSIEAESERRSLDEVARQFGLEVLQGEITEDFAVLSAVGTADEAQDWIFEDQEGPGAISPLFENRDVFYLVEILEVAPAGTLSLDDVAGEIERTLRTRKKEEMVLEEARGWAQELRAGGSIEALAERLGLSEPAQAEAFSREDFVPGLGQQTPGVGVAFGTAVGAIGGPVLSDGRVVLVRVDAREEADREEWEAQKDFQRMEATATIQQERLGTWLEGLRETTRIVDNRAAYFRAVEEMQDRPQIPMAF
jgi:peptidyl-prolyl cis-trans isomerase D